MTVLDGGVNPAGLRRGYTMIGVGLSRASSIGPCDEAHKNSGTGFNSSSESRLESHWSFSGTS